MCIEGAPRRKKESYLFVTALQVAKSFILKFLRLRTPSIKEYKGGGVRLIEWGCTPSPRLQLIAHIESACGIRNAVGES